ncbi:MAG: JDVT-CTERM domain-containing protein, partial [Zetaproteobacteria bacterium]|nr:JDVT-CTERM domain-containing protein [Zetaproteobacteria bacterium]
GTYTLNYNVTDAAGNIATTVSRTVNVGNSTAQGLGTANITGVTLPKGTVNLQASNNASFNSISTPAAPANTTTLTFPMGALAYEVSVNAGATITMTFTFSQSLPATFNLYKLDQNNNSTLIPQNSWQKVNATTIDLTLQDGGILDQDGTINGIIVDPFAIGVIPPTAAPPTSSGGGGGCSIQRHDSDIDPLLILLLLLATIHIVKRKQADATVKNL